MKNITLAVVIVVGFCAAEAVAQISTRARPLGLLRAQPLGSLRERRALREQQEFETLIANGNTEQKLKQLEDEVLKSRALYEKMLALEEKSKMLSADALAIYKERTDALKREYETCSNRLARARVMLTPEKIAEFEQKKKAEEEAKARKQRVEEEYRAFAAEVENEIAAEEKAQRAAERAEREKERAEQRAQLSQMQEELRKAHEAAEKER